MEMTRARIKKAYPLTLGVICLLISIGVLFLFGSNSKPLEMWGAFGLFFLGGLVFIWTAFPKTFEIEIDDYFVSLGGIKIDRGNIVYARVFRAWSNGGRGRYIEFQFKEMPHLPIGWRILNFLQRAGFPNECELGITLACEPRIIAPLHPTDLTDAELNSAINYSEQSPKATRQTFDMRVTSFDTDSGAMVVQTQLPKRDPKGGAPNP